MENIRLFVFGIFFYFILYFVNGGQLKFIANKVLMSYFMDFYILVFSIDYIQTDCKQIENKFFLILFYIDKIRLRKFASLHWFSENLSLSLSLFSLSIGV